MNENIIKLIGILLIVGSILFASVAVYSFVAEQLQNTSERIEQIYKY